MPNRNRAFKNNEGGCKSGLKNTLNSLLIYIFTFKLDLGPDVFIPDSVESPNEYIKWLYSISNSNYFVKNYVLVINAYIKTVKDDTQEGYVHEKMKNYDNKIWDLSYYK